MCKELRQLDKEIHQKLQPNDNDNKEDDVDSNENTEHHNDTVEHTDDHKQD